MLLKYRQPRTMLEYDFEFHNPTTARHWSIPITVVYLTILLSELGRDPAHRGLLP